MGVGAVKIFTGLQRILLLRAAFPTLSLTDVLAERIAQPIRKERMNFIVMFSECVGGGRVFCSRSVPYDPRLREKPLRA
jgi:hypothetical protein